MDVQHAILPCNVRIEFQLKVKCYVWCAVYIYIVISNVCLFSGLIHYLSMTGMKKYALM